MKKLFFFNAQRVYNYNLKRKNCFYDVKISYKIKKLESSNFKKEFDSFLFKKLKYYGLTRHIPRRLSMSLKSP